METKAESYKVAIKSLIENGKVEEAMDAVDTLVKYALRIEMQYAEKCKQNQTDPDDDQVNNPSHYQSMVSDLNIDAISCMRAAFGNEEVASFCICNALKYIFRHQSKNGKQDIEKAIWYLNKYLELNNG